MRGVHRVTVHTKRLHYDFELRRNITIIRGDSATGKTTLVDMVQEYASNPSGSPVELVCDKACHVLTGSLWKEQLSGIQDSIVFIDEGNEFVRSDDFAREIQKTDNYYVIVSRESLPALPYSVTEIYGIRTSGKYGTLKPCYHELYRIYGTELLTEEVKPQTIITEDSNAGYQFFHSICCEHDLRCCSAGGKSNVFHYLNSAEREKGHFKGKVLVIADGAAFGSEIDRVIKLINEKGNAVLYLPESFEWLILSSELWSDSEIRDILDAPYNHVECQKYFSWERYFTALLIAKSKDTFLAYSKRQLNRNYLSQRAKAAILAVMERIEID